MISSPVSFMQHCGTVITQYQSWLALGTVHCSNRLVTELTDLFLGCPSPPSTWSILPASIVVLTDASKHMSISSAFSVFRLVSGTSGIIRDFQLLVIFVHRPGDELKWGKCVGNKRKCITMGPRVFHCRFRLVSCRLLKIRYLHHTLE